MIFFSGQGECGTGNWCFPDGTIGIEDIVGWMLTESMEYPTIICEANYSGHWANYCAQKGISGLECLAACRENEVAHQRGKCFQNRQENATEKGMSLGA